MNIRKIIFLLSLVVAVLAFSSCSDPEPCLFHVDGDGDYKCDNCTADMTPEAHYDEDRNYICDVCGGDFFPDCGGAHTNNNDNNKCDVCGQSVPVEITVSIVDQEGNPIPGVTVIITDEDYDELEGTTGSDGKFTVPLVTGTYGISYDAETVPENYIAGTTTRPLTDEDRTIELELINNTPNGTAERPYIISSDEEVNSVTIPANTKYEYKVPFGGGRTATFVSSDIEVLYHVQGEDGSYTSTTYTPDPDGRITFKLVETDTNTPTLFSIENKTDESITFDILLTAELGTHAKPIIIEDIAGPVVCGITADKMVNYKWVATDAGTLNISTDLVYTFRKGIGASTLLVKTEGGEGLVGTYIAVLDGGTVTLTVTDTTIEVVDQTTDADNVSGSYSYTVNNGEIVIAELSSGNETGAFSLKAGGVTVAVTNSRNSQQQVIKDGVTEISLTVLAGDEIRLVFSSAYSTEISLKMELEVAE